MQHTLLSVTNATKVFKAGFFGKQRFVAVDSVSLNLKQNDPRILTIAGESGSGKTTLAQMILGFLPNDSGSITFCERDIYRMGWKDANHYRRQVQAVFQNPFDAFNPFYKINRVFDIPIRRVRLARTSSDAARLIREALDAVHLNPEETLGRFPHQLSGGQLQRVMIGRALLLKPQLIIADEPVSMIDVSLRAIILNILVKLKQDFGISLLYITHDLSTALQISDEILIMYRGSVVEQGAAEMVIQTPMHPYTQLLVASIPLPDPNQKWIRPLELQINPDAAAAFASGCKFIDRCPERMDRCRSSQPAMFDAGENHKAACFLYENKS